MCHEVFDYTPTRKVNFLTGVNGSGKSAVMSALIFGLGGGSKITNRGSANKNLIRTGQGQASVEISLYNRGETAYRSVSFFFSIYLLRECDRNLDLWVQMHPGELWVSKSVGADSTRSLKISGCKS